MTAVSQACVSERGFRTASQSIFFRKNLKASHVYEVSVCSRPLGSCVHEARRRFSGTRTAVIGSEGETLTMIAADS